jgi:NADP-dependent 3-hydroxy acid dehydrogenase YdfG
MLLQNKNVIIYGAGGSLGGAVARAFSAAGARLFLTGRNVNSVQKVADEINASGGYAEAAQVDALDEYAVNTNMEILVQKAGTVDISFCAINYEVVQNMPLIEISAADFVRPVTLAMQAQFITAKAAAKVMMKQGSGVILSLTATPGGIGYPLTGGFAPACSAIEKLSSNLAAELGIYGIRVVNIRSAGSPDSMVFKEAIENHPDVMKSIIPQMEGDTMLKKLPAMADIANTAVFFF